MMIPAVAMMLLSVSSCDSGIQKGTFDDVLAAIPAGSSAETMQWQRVGDVCDLGGDAGDLFGRLCRLKGSDPVALVRASGAPEVLVSPITDVAVAEDATADWERVELGRDGLSGRVCVAEGGTIVLGGRLVWLVPAATEVSAAVHAVSTILDVGGGLPLPVREALKPGADIAVALNIEDKYITATVACNDAEVEIRGELRDSVGAVYDFSEYAQPLNGPICDRPACVALALGLHRGALARAVSEHVRPRLGVKEKLAFAAVSDILRDVCGTLRATLQMEGAAATVRVSMPYAEGGAAAATRRVAAMTQRFELQNMVHVRAVGDTLMQLKIVVGERPQLFDGAAPMPAVASDKDGDVLMAVGVAPVSDGIMHLEGVQAVVRQRGFVVTLLGTDLRRLTYMQRLNTADDPSLDEYNIDNETNRNNHTG